MKNPPCKRKYYTVIFLVVFLPFLFFNAGCWDREELEELAFVMVIGIDYLPEEEKLEVTTIINHPRGLAMQAGGEGGGNDEPFHLITTQGISISTALEQQNAFIARRAYFGHNEVIVVGEKLARQGLHQILDRLIREREVRLGNYMYVTADDVKKVLRSHTKIEEGLATFLSSQPEGTISSLAPVVDIRKFVRSMLDEGIEPVLALLSTRTEAPISPGEAETSGQVSPEEGLEKTLPDKLLVPEISGAGVFKGDRLAGFMDIDETKGLLYMQGEIKNSLEIIKDPLGNAGYITLNVLESRSKIAPFFQDGSPGVLLEVKAKSEIC
jgi:spore germination protein KC